MTVLVLAQKKILLLLKISVKWEELLEAFFRINRSGVITSSATAVIVISTIGYLLAAYFIFGLGFAIQEQSKETSRLENSVIRKELNLHDARIRFAHSGSELFSSMERVTSVKYLVPQGFAVSGMGGRP